MDVRGLGKLLCVQAPAYPPADFFIWSALLCYGIQDGSRNSMRDTAGVTFCVGTSWLRSVAINREGK